MIGPRLLIPKRNRSMEIPGVWYVDELKLKRPVDISEEWG